MVLGINIAAARRVFWAYRHGGAKKVRFAAKPTGIKQRPHACEPFAQQRILRMTQGRIFGVKPDGVDAIMLRQVNGALIVKRLRDNGNPVFLKHFSCAHDGIER